MREQYRRYWGEQRHNWFRGHRGRDLGYDRYEGRDRGYKDDPRYERSGPPDREGGWMHDHGDDRRHGRRDGRKNGNDQWLGGYGRGTAAVPLPNASAPQGRGRGQNYGSADGQPTWLSGGT